MSETFQMWWARERGTAGMFAHKKSYHECWTAARASQWRDIETAPRDGTAVILGFWYHGRFAQYVGFGELSGWMENSRQFYPMHMQNMFTHWQPLPQPPVSK